MYLITTLGEIKYDILAIPKMVYKVIKEAWKFLGFRNKHNVLLLVTRWNCVCFCIENTFFNVPKFNFFIEKLAFWINRTSENW